MSPDKPDLEAWLNQNVNWMVSETAQYFENRERLALCQTVATMLLTQALNRMGEGREESLRQALAGQAELLAKLEGGAKAGARKGGKAGG